MTRPSFLTVLCILTFIGSGYRLFNSISNYTNPEVSVGVAQEIFEQTSEQMENENMSNEEQVVFDKMINSVINGLTVENLKNFSTAAGISSILCLIGAILMWGLDKKGFWLYAIGASVLVIAPPVIFKGILGAGIGAYLAFTGILFTILYAVNLKHMK